MANQSLISVPPNIEEPVVLRRFLSSLVEQLDIVLGNRAGVGTKYVETQQLVSAAALLREEVISTTEELQAAADKLQNTLELTADLIENRLVAIETLNTKQSAAINNYLAVKAIQLTFTVDGSNNVVHNVAYNIDTLSSTRISTGLYEFELSQATFDGNDIIGNITVSLQEAIVDSTTSEAYHVSFSNSGLPAGTFRILVQAITVGTGSKLQYDPYDLLPDDFVTLTALYNIPGSSVPTGVKV